MTHALKIINLEYKNGDKIVFKDINLTLSYQEIVCIIGENGIGKTTFLKIAAGLKRQTSGEVHIFDEKMDSLRDFNKYRKDIGFLFQDSDDQFLAPTVLEDVAFGLLNKGIKKEIAIKETFKMLETFNIVSIANNSPLKLSGGEKRLVALAGVLIIKPKILILDEPTNGLDKINSKKIIDIISSIDATILMASHDLDFINTIKAKKVLLKKNGLIDISD